MLTFDYRRHPKRGPTIEIMVDGYTAIIEIPEKVGAEIERVGGKLMAQTVRMDTKSTGPHVIPTYKAELLLGKK